MISQIDHIGIAVQSLEEAKSLYSKIFNVSSYHEEAIESQQVNIATFLIGEVRIELLEATDPDSPIAKFIEKKGEGIHHIAFRESEIGSKIEELKESKINMINEKPFVGAHEMLVAFLHPKSTGGVLMELCQPKSRPNK